MAHTYAYTPRLQKQRSVPAVIDAGVWCGKIPRTGGFRRTFEQDVDENGEFGESGYAGATTRPVSAGLIRGLWRRIVEQKRKILNQRGPSSVREQYDHDEYVQNFDEGAESGEPENLSRSFSARYAGPARAL